MPIGEMMERKLPAVRGGKRVMRQMASKDATYDSGIRTQGGRDREGAARRDLCHAGLGGAGSAGDAACEGPHHGEDGAHGEAAESSRRPPGSRA